jgi:hypothetical protein
MKRITVIFAIILLAVVSLASQVPQAELIDEFGWVSCEDLRARLDTFLAVLSNKPGAMGLVYVYEGKYEVVVYDKKDRRTEVRLPVIGEAAHRTNIFRVHFGFRKFDPNRYLFIDGGYRENFTVQLWIVPNGATPPPAKPTQGRMKYRKGKFAAVECP